MKRNSRILAFAAALSASAYHLAAQEPIIILPGQVFVAQQTPPAPAAPPAPPAPPAIAFGDTLKWMTANGSYLGVGVRDVNEERKKALNLKEERGAEITSVEDESPAAKAGLKTGDVVTEYNGQRVEGMEQFIRMVRETPAGREVKITVVRNGSNTTVSARPENLSNRMAKSLQSLRDMAPQMRGWTIEAMPRPAMNWQSTSLGIEAESLNEQLASFFGVKQGVLVRSVSSGSIAEKAGIKAGDIIVKVDGTEVKSPREVTTQLRSARNKSKEVSLTLSRDKREQPLKVTFPDEQGPESRPMPRVRSVQNRELQL
jgi:serine protease Do